MQFKKLYKTVVLVNFSKDSSRPFMNALLRIFSAVAIALVVGKLIANIITKNQLPSDIPDQVIMTATIIPAFFLSGFSLMTLHANSGSVQKKDSLTRSVKLMPLPRTTRWLVNLLPGLIILGILSIFSLTIIFPLSDNLEVSLLKVLISWFIGIVSGFGFVMQKFIVNSVLKSILFLFINFSSIYIFNLVFSAETEAGQNVLLSLINLLIFIPILLFIATLFSTKIHSFAVGSSSDKQIIPLYLPASYWFMVKVWRNKRTRSTLLQSFTISLLISTYVILKNKVFTDPYVLLLFAAMLSAMVASEIRGIMRRYLPPEIILINGVKGIVKSEVITLAIINLIIGLPILFSVHGQSSNSFTFLIFYLVIQIFASIGGLLASTILVPANNEAGSQFFSVTMAMSLLYVVPKIAKFSELKPDQQIIYWFLSALVAYGLVYAIELIRRRKYGHA